MYFYWNCTRQIGKQLVYNRSMQHFQVYCTVLQKTIFSQIKFFKMNMKYWIIYNIRVYVMFNQIPLKKQQVLPPPTPLISQIIVRLFVKVNFDLFSKLLMVLASCCLFQTLGFLDIVALYYIGMVFTILQGILHCSSVGSCFWVAF